MNPKGFTSGGVLAKNTLINLLGMVLPILVGIAAIPYAIKGLGTEGFGILSITWVILGYFALLDFGLAKATTKFIAEIFGRKDNQNISTILWTAIVVSFVFGIIGTIILFLVTPYLVYSLLKIPPSYLYQAKVSFYLSAGSLPFILFSTSLRGALGAAQRFDLVNLVLVPTSILSYLFPALSLPFRINLPTVILLIILVRIIASFIYLFLCFKVFPILRTNLAFSWTTFRRLISYGGWITITGVISPILVYIDRFFIGSILSISFVAFYAAPYDAINRLRILPIAIMKTFFPEFSALSHDNENRRIETLFGRSIKYILLPMGVVAIFLIYYAHEILQLWLGDQFADKATTILRLFSFGIIINSLAYIPFNLLQGIGKPDLPAKFHLVEFPIYISLLWFLTKSFGITGAAIAWLIRVTLDFILLYSWTVKLYPDTVRYLNKNKIWHEGFLLVILGLFLPLSRWLAGSILMSAIMQILFMLILTAIVWYYIFDESERKLVYSLPGKFVSPEGIE